MLEAQTHSSRLACVCLRARALVYLFVCVRSVLLVLHLCCSKRRSGPAKTGHVGGARTQERIGFVQRVRAALLVGSDRVRGSCLLMGPGGREEGLQHLLQHLAREMKDHVETAHPTIVCLTVSSNTLIVSSKTRTAQRLFA